KRARFCPRVFVVSLAPSTPTPVTAWAKARNGLSSLSDALRAFAHPTRYSLFAIRHSLIEQRPLPLVLLALALARSFRRGRRRRLRRRRRDQLRPVVLGAIDRGRNLVGLEQTLARGRDQRGGGLGVDAGAVEPEIEGVGRHDHRHAVVQRAKLGAGGGAGDAGGLHSAP